MILPIFLISTLAIIPQTLAASVPAVESAEIPTEANAETFDSYAVQHLPQQLPLTIQLPKETPPASPFYPPQPAPYLTAPQYDSNEQPNLYRVPVPSEYLTAPTEDEWNPNNDPELFYYELPASITKNTIPTNLYPKKYNKEVHSKGKPLSAVPKKEIELEPINESELSQKQKDLYKTIDNISKKQNQRLVEQEKQVPKSLLKNHKGVLHNQHTKPTIKTKTIVPPLRPTTTIKPILHGHYLDSTDDSRLPSTFGKNSLDDNNKPNKGRVSDSMGIPSSYGVENKGKDRLMFHMAGQDGPMSYKWGYDTGKGPNRQYRFEERDKEGVVKGQFGYFDKEGKFRVMNYRAHPEHGYHMEPAPESEVSE
ncbi:uncharacterized protein LOC126743807 [Anthonomus grandis grandis]|uniref:uncharacterized protein LOC126743807 n=1 Tax=Anthonomus grandis grandis TaxID=2921223 RepID=UPI002166526F|nr:uncharacterized protein LOC126743807 [Anthonomus grandis grandis]